MLWQSNPGLQRYGDVVSVLTARNVKTRYRGSALGVAWSLLNPVIMTLVYTAVFGHAFATYYRGSTLYYMLAVFVGLVVNGFFATATTSALHSIVSSSGLINKVRAPLSSYPMAQLLSTCVQLCCGAVPFLVIITLAVTHNVLYALLLAVPLASLVLLAAGAGYMVATLYVFFRDIPYVYDLVIFVTWVATPIFYPLSIVAPRFRGVIEWNPLTQIVETIRGLAFLNRPPGAFGLLEPLCAGVVLAASAWFVFRRLSPRFMDYL